MVARTRWLDAGLDVLGEGGLPALRIETVAGRLCLTKGSFYHHFVDLADYRRALLGHLEERFTRSHIAASEGSAGRDPLERITALADRVLTDPQDPRLDVAVRTWAAQDDDARDTVERIDALRLEHLRTLFAELAGAADADRLARTAYYLLVGSQHVLPPGPPEELRAMWDELLTPWRAGRPA